jgi:hypothetical protein
LAGQMIGAVHQQYAGYQHLLLPDQVAEGSQSNPGQTGRQGHTEGPDSDFQYLSM